MARRGRTTGGTIRRLWPFEAERLLAHLLRLGPEDRFYRFHIAMSDAAIAAYVGRIDWLNGAVVVLLEEGEVRGAAHIGWAGEGWTRTGEVGLSVETAHQRQGFGTELLARTLTLARNRMVSDVAMLCLPDNLPMRRVADKLSVRVVVDHDLAEARAELGWPDQFSVMSEVVAETGALLRLPL